MVIGQASGNYGIIPHETGQFMVVVAGLSMLLTPLLAVLARWAAHRIKPKSTVDAEDIVDNEIHDHVIIAGYGRVGQIVAEVLRIEAIPYLAIDHNADDVKRHKQRDKAVYVGDASRAEILRKSGIDRAAVLLITMNSPRDALRTLHVARQYWPDLPVIVRSRDDSHSRELIEAGATQVVPETHEASLQLSAYVLRSAGFSREESYQCIEAIRRNHTVNALGDMN